MHKLIKKISKPGMLFGFLVLVLTACTGKEDIVLELSDTGTTQETESFSGKEEFPGTEDNLLDESAGYVSDILSDTVQAQKIYVHICGAVVNPGVYELEEGSRVFEGIEAAGGFSEDACEDYVNQAGRLSDGERLVIPTKEEIETAKVDGTYQELWASEASAAGLDASETGAAGTSIDENGLVNINTASEGELGSISGIGAGKAAAIVQYRQENGSFTSIEDIMKVSGIKEGTYEKIKDKITVN